MGMDILSYGVLMMILALVVLVVIVAIAVWAVHLSGSGHGGGASHPHPRQILDLRYAKGEIDGEEYQRIRREVG
jgi:putative membrane protein